MSRPFIVGVGGYTSNVGKTTLLCELLRALPGWEAIKTTRGHYRSCGKDPVSCCVTHLLSDEPVIRSGRNVTYEAGKDTGRYWDAGAANVHWLIATDDQIERGIIETVARTKSRGVLIEGNSFSRFVRPDYFVMVRRSDGKKMKASARRLLDVSISAIYVSDEDADATGDEEYVPIYTPRELPLLIADIKSRSACRGIDSSELNHTQAT